MMRDGCGAKVGEDFFGGAIVSLFGSVVSLTASAGMLLGRRLLVQAVTIFQTTFYRQVQPCTSGTAVEHYTFYNPLCGRITDLK
jgi:hypothetical protein